MLSETVTKLAAERAGRWGTSTNTTAAITEALAAEERAARLAQQKKEAEEEKKNAGPAVAHEEEDVEKMWELHQLRMAGKKPEHQLYRTSAKVLGTLQDDKVVLDAGKDNVRASKFSVWCARGMGVKNTSLVTGVYKSKSHKIHDGVWKPQGAL